MDKIERIKELVNILNKASDAYYNTDKSIISDQEFDKLFDELKQLEIETNFVMSNSVTQNVGFEVKSKLEKVEHTIPLKSLGKTKSIDEVEKFIGNKEILIMLKGDGLTCELIYNNGELIQGSTRGNSIIGENITHNVRKFKNIPLHINYKGYLKLAGESVIFDKDFELVNSKLKKEDKYSNSRNLVAGSVRQLDSKICDKRNVNFLAFTLLECEDKQFETLEEQFEFLKGLGFEIIPYDKNTDTLEDLNTIISDLKQYANISGIPIDGEVVKYNNIAYGKSLGETEHHPLSAIALKFQDDEYETKYIKTEWQVSRTSMINPVGVFQPVDLDGAITERATLHNIDYFEALQLGKDDIITVARQNQVIPKILSNKTRSNTEIIPKACPICGSKTEIKLQKTARFLYCTNDNCPSKKVAQIEHYCSRDAMNIVGLSSATIEKFIDKGFIKELLDIYRLPNYKKEITHMDGMGVKSYNNLIKSIENSREVELYKFLFALGIPNVGKSTAKDLANFVNNNIGKLFGITVSKLVQINDCGEVTANSIANYFNDEENIDMIDKLIGYSYVSIKENKKVDTTEIKDNLLLGKHIYPTGKFSLKKDELKQKLEAIGAIVENGYKKSLDYLICGGDTSKSGKVEKAIRDGVPCMSETELMKILGE